MKAIFYHPQQRRYGLKWAIHNIQRKSLCMNSKFANVVDCAVTINVNNKMFSVKNDQVLKLMRIMHETND